MPKNLCQTKKISVPTDFTKSERAELAEDIIDYIIERTQAGLGEDRKKYPGKDANTYSPSYGKKGRVDLTLTGEMLQAALVQTVDKVGEIAVGIPFGDDAWGKAKGNILGSYGKSANRDKARPFLNLGDVDMDIIETLIETHVARKKGEE